MIRRLVLRAEGGPCRSSTVRRIFRSYHGVDVGLYTHGKCFEPGMFDPQTTIGRYCSIAAGARVLNANHRLDFKSTHPYFFNPDLGVCRESHRRVIPLMIGNDVWLGHGCIIMPNVQAVGDGAVIAAGAVVNKDVPPYAIVVGNPARAVRFRFPPEVIVALLAERWWEKAPEELEVGEFTRPYVDGADEEAS